MPLKGSLPVMFFTCILNCGNTGRTADQDHLVDLRSLKTRILQRLLHGAHRFVDQVGRQLVELCTW